MVMQPFSFSILINLAFFGSFFVAEKVRYISTEHPVVTYIYPKCISYLNLTAQRYGRDDPFYYVGLHMYFEWPVYNNITVDFVFYEFLSNRYKPSFVEMHFRLCDLVHKDKFFGSALKQGKFDQPCPYQAGAYNLYNMTIPVKHIPPNFPFHKGRIYCNMSSSDTKELCASGYIDMEVKETRIRKRKSKSILAARPGFARVYL